jgi:hypothetical protein
MWADAIKGFFAGLAQGVLALFGMSDAQKLGRAEVTMKGQAATIREISDGKAIEMTVLSEPVGAAEQWLHEHKPKD